MRQVSSKRRKVTSKGKASARIFSEAMGQERLQQIGQEVIRTGKSAIDGVIYEVGQLLVETIMYMEREEIAGPDYQPIDPAIHKGGTQQGFAYLGDQKIGLRRSGTPTMRGWAVKSGGEPPPGWGSIRHRHSPAGRRTESPSGAG